MTRCHASLILIGQDFRNSSRQIALNCTNALAGLGFRALNCGAVPTPALALYGLQLGAASLMVTGSHIPADRNGIKFYRPDGEINKQAEEAIAALAAAEGLPQLLPALAVSDNRSAECLEFFLERNRSLLPKDALKGLRLGVYQHSTVARDLLVDVLRFYGAEVVPLGRSDSFIPVDTEAVSPPTVRLLQSWAQDHQLDAPVSADGDGDRPLVADEKGIPVRGDLLGLVTARFFNAQVLVTPVTSNSGIEAIRALRVERQAPMSEIAASFHLPVAAADRLENFPTEGSAALMAHLCASDSNLSDFLRSVGEVQAKTGIDGLCCSQRGPHHPFQAIWQCAGDAVLCRSSVQGEG